jgi:hypothetical protein
MKTEGKADVLITRVAERYAFDTFAMANLRPKTTGVEGVVIWISSGEFAMANLQHGPRINVVLGEKITTEGLQEAISVTITNNPQVLGKLPRSIKKQVLDFVKKNQDVLIQHWNGELDSKETLDRIQRI